MEGINGTEKVRNKDVENSGRTEDSPRDYHQEMEKKLVG